MKESKAYARCRACNTQFYPTLYRETGTFEELCSVCKEVSSMTSRVDDVLYGITGETSEKWNPEQDKEDKEYVQEFINENQLIQKDLLKEDDYFEFGEEAFGNLGLFDK